LNKANQSIETHSYQTQTWQ